MTVSAEGGGADSNDPVTGYWAPFVLLTVIFTLALDVVSRPGAAGADRAVFVHFCVILTPSPSPLTLANSIPF